MSRFKGIVQEMKLIFVWAFLIFKFRLKLNKTISPVIKFVIDNEHWKYKDGFNKLKLI